MKIWIRNTKTWIIWVNCEIVRKNIIFIKRWVLHVKLSTTFTQMSSRGKNWNWIIINQRGFIAKTWYVIRLCFCGPSESLYGEALRHLPWNGHWQSAAGRWCSARGTLWHGLSPPSHGEATQSWCEVCCSAIGRERVVWSLASRISGDGSMGVFVDADC
jgi:hypothetical protein